MTALPPAASFQRAAAKPRPIAYRLHSLFGLKLSLFLAFVCLTGTIATVSHEIEWLLSPKVRATAGAPRWGAMWDAARAAHPDGWVRSLGTYDRSDAPYFAKAAEVALPDGREVRVLVDPGSAQVTGEQHGVTFHAFMRGLHYYLFAPGDWGFYPVAALGFALLGSLVSGLIVYKRFWKGLWRKPRRARGARTWLGDLHRLGAVWSIPFVLIIAVTAIWYLLERDLLAWETPPPVAAPLRTQPDGATIDRWVATAAAAMPGLEVTAVSLPYADGDPVIVQGQWRAWLVRERTNAAYLDPVSGRLLGLRVAHQVAATERWVHTADPLHFGTFASLGTRLLWVVLGLVLTGLAATGAIIHGKRLAAPVEPGMARAWRRGLGAALAPSLVLILIVPTWSYAAGWDSGSGAQRTEAGRMTAGGTFYTLTRLSDRWCARPDGEAPAGLAFVDRAGRSHPAAFDAGAFCAELGAQIPAALQADDGAAPPAG